jgi:hypothetical protein
MTESRRDAERDDYETRRIARNEEFLCLAWAGMPRWRAWLIASLKHRRWTNAKRARPPHPTLSDENPSSVVGVPWHRSPQGEDHEARMIQTHTSRSGSVSESRRDAERENHEAGIRAMFRAYEDWQDGKVEDPFGHMAAAYRRAAYLSRCPPPQSENHEADELWQAARAFVVEGAGPNSERLIDLSDAALAYGKARRLSRCSSPEREE